MKRILIDCTTLSKKTDGLTQYTLSILIELLKITDAKFIIIYRENELPNNYLNQIMTFNSRVELKPVEMSPIGPKRDYNFSKWFRKNKNSFDLFYEPSAQYPKGVNGGLYTIHDILYEEFPEKLGKYARLKRYYLHHVVRRGLKNAKIVIAVSQFTKDEICKYHGKKFENKIQVVYEGYEHLKNVKLLENDSFINNLLSFKNHFFLYIGSSRGHKNLHNLFLAYELAAVEWKLVVVGRMDRLECKDKKLVEKINHNEKKIIFTGWIDDNQMYTILSEATAFIFPSKSEGFGIPVLESWYFGVPLLCSDIPVFNEIVGDACIKFNPLDIKDISNKLRDFTKRSDKDNALLIDKEKECLNKYSWTDAAMNIKNILIDL